MQRTSLQLWTLSVVIAVASSALATTLPVHCNQPGHTITQALKVAKPGDTIQVSGTCEETLNVTTDRLTLDGQGSAVIDGGGGGAPGLTLEGVITVDGAQGVTITGFTVRHGAADGITGRRGAAFTVRNTLVEDNADDGIQAGEFATVKLIDCTVRRSGEHGIVVAFNSSALFQGTIESSENTRYGIFVFGSSHAHFLPGATIQTHHNGDQGILIATGGSAFTSAQIATDDNGRFGVTLAIGASLQGSGGAIHAARNRVNGLQVGNGATVTLVGTTVTLEDNEGTGLNVVGSSRVLSSGALTIEGNAKGVSVNDSSVAINGASITDNGTDVALAFGARVSLSNSTFDTITCDETVLLQTELPQGMACP